MVESHTLLLLLLHSYRFDKESAIREAESGLVVGWGDAAQEGMAESLGAGTKKQVFLSKRESERRGEIYLFGTSKSA